MLEKLTAETFVPFVGRTFRVRVGDRWEMRARLTAVETWSEDSGKGRPRAPFTLVFHASAEAKIPQRTYVVETEGLDPLDLFLVPMGPDEQGMRYDAVFT